MLNEIWAVYWRSMVGGALAAALYLTYMWFIVQHIGGNSEAE